MKRTLAFAAAVALVSLVLVVSGCGKNSSENTFTVGFDPEYPPFGFVDTAGEFGEAGAYVGFDLDLAELVCEKAGWEFVAVPIDWTAKDALLESGEITCVWDGFTHEGREDDYQWSMPYMVNAQVVVVKADSGYSSLADLAGKVVLTQASVTGYDLMQTEYADANATFAQGGVQTVASYAEAFRQLEAELCDAVICDISYFAYQDMVKAGMFANIVTLSSEHYAVGFAKDNPDAAAMIAEINRAFKQLDSDGQIRALCDKYAAYGADYGAWCV